MLAATSPIARGFLFRSPCRPRRSDRQADRISVEEAADDRITGSWFIIAGYSSPAFCGGRGAEPMTVVRSDRRSLRFRILDRLARRDRYRVLWQDVASGQCVLARADQRRVWILSRTPAMPTRELFQRVADLRQRGFDTRPLQYAHVA